MKKNTREEFLLKQAVAAYVEEEMTRLPSDEEIGMHQFSPEFERKMEKLLMSTGPTGFCSTPRASA